MTSHTGVEKKLWEHGWATVVFAALLFSTLALAFVLISGQASAVDDGGCEPDCGGGGTTTTITRILSVTSPSQGVVTDDGGGINCGNGNSDCTQPYSFIRTCDEFSTCEDSGVDTAVLTASGGPSGYSPNWTGCSSVTNNQCTVVMDVSRTVSLSWVDMTNPTVTLTSPADGAKVGMSFQAAANASDNAGVSRVEFLVDGIVKSQVTTSPYAATISTTGYAHGSSHTVSARAVDVNGRQSPLSAEANVTIDKQVSVALGATPAQDSYVTSTNPVTLTFTTDSDVLATGIQCRTTVGTSVGSFAQCSSPYTVPTSADGPYTVEVKVTDNVGNTDTGKRDFTLDRTAPSLSVNAGPNAETFGPGTTQEWTFSASDATSGPPTVECSVVPQGQDAAFGSCTTSTSHSVNNKPDGSYTFKARATDGAGNQTVRSRNFTIDATAPQTTITSGVEDGKSTNQTSLTWTFSSSETGSTFECLVYPAATSPPAFEDCSGGTFSKSNFTSGSTYAFEVRATDAVGNEGPSQKRIFTIDTTAPTATGKPTGTRVSPTANVIATFSEEMNDTSVEKTNANDLPTTFTLKKKGTTKTLAATVVYSEPTATTFKAVLNPGRNLRAGATYIATVSSAATDLAGNPLVKKTWKFTVK